MSRMISEVCLPWLSEILYTVWPLEFPFSLHCPGTVVCQASSWSIGLHICSQWLKKAPMLNLRLFLWTVPSLWFTLLQIPTTSASLNSNHCHTSPVRLLCSAWVLHPYLCFRKYLQAKHQGYYVDQLLCFPSFWDPSPVLSCYPILKAVASCVLFNCKIFYCRGLFRH